MSTITFYRPVGSTEIARLEAGDWAAFPSMPEGFGFWMYAQPLSDPRDWPAQLEDVDYFDALEAGQEEVVKSWPSWGNQPDTAYVVAFEVDERLYGASGDQRADVELVNQALVGPVTIHESFTSPDSDNGNSARPAT